MNTRFLETLIVLARLRSFRATARALHATPAAISLRIKCLEEELGVELVDRSSKHFRLTSQAEYLLDYVRSVVNATRDLYTAAREKNAIRGRLRLGVVESVVHSWLSFYIRKLNEIYPDLEVDLAVDMSTVLDKRIRAGELDLVFIVDGTTSDNIVSEILAIYPVGWIARSGLIAIDKDELAERALQVPILTFGRGSTPQRMVEDIVAQLASMAGVPLKQTRITCSPSVAAIVQLVKEGYGLAAIPSLFVREQLDSGEFVEIPLQPSPPSIVVSMCMHTNANVLVHLAANVARESCAIFCANVERRFIETVR